MPIAVLFLVILALVLFMLAMTGIPSPPRFNWIPAGWFFLTLAWLIQRVPLL